MMIDYPGGDRIRAVTHYGISEADIDATIDATRRALHSVGLARGRDRADRAAPPHRSVTAHGGHDGPDARPATPVTDADRQFEALVRDRFDALVERYPVLGTFLGLTEHDGRLSDGSRDAVLAEIDDTRRFETGARGHRRE